MTVLIRFNRSRRHVIVAVANAAFAYRGGRVSLIFLIVVGAAVGVWLLRGVTFPASEGVAYRFFLGWCLCAVLIMLLGSISLYMTKSVFAVMAFIGLVYLVVRLLRRRDLFRLYAIRATGLSWLEVLAVASIVIANGLTLFSALAPNTSWDAGAAHLALPSDYAREGRIELVEGNVYSAYPHLLHGVYAFLYAGGGERSVTLFSWLVGALACAVMFGLGRRVGGRACGWIAAGIFATSPIFFDQVGVASIDVPFAALTVAALACAVAWYDEKRVAYLVLAGFFAGSSCGIRHTGYLVCVLLVIGVVWVARDRRAMVAATFGAVAFIAAAPWLIRSALVSGNPVYPFLSEVFPSVALPDLQTTALNAHETVRGSGLFNLLMFPWRLIMQPEGFDGWSKSPGGLVLLLGVPGFFVGGRRARALGAFGIAGLVCFFFFQRLARYLLPFFMPLMVVASVAVFTLPRLRRPVHALVAVSLVYGLMLGVAAVHFKVPVALGMESKTAYLSARVERYPAFAWVNANLPESAGIMTLDPRSYYIDRPTFQNYAMLPVLDSMSATERDAWFAERHIEYLLYPTSFFSESPAYVARGYTAIVDQWRADRTFLRLVKVIEVPRLRRDGVERVEIYQVRQAIAKDEPHVGR